MNIVLWILAGLLSFMFLMVGTLKLVKGKDKMLEEQPERMAWVDDLSDTQIKLIGLVEVLGAIGLIAPLATGILPILVPLAAAGLALDMLVASRLRIRRGEPIRDNLVLLVLALIVAVGRFAGV